jgi:hypothetical protein
VSRVAAGDEHPVIDDLARQRPSGVWVAFASERHLCFDNERDPSDGRKSDVPDALFHRADRCEEGKVLRSLRKGRWLLGDGLSFQGEVLREKRTVR